MNIQIGRWRETASYVTGSLSFNDLQKIHDDGVTCRNTCRTFITIRSGLSIYSRSNKDEVEGFFNDAKNLHVVVPKALKAALEAL